MLFVIYRASASVSWGHSIGGIPRIAVRIYPLFSI